MRPIDLDDLTPQQLDWCLPADAGKSGAVSFAAHAAAVNAAEGT